MTYAETVQKPPFDWNEFLGRKDLTEQETAAANKISMSWVTCACGNLCASLPRGKNGMPEDNELAQLGYAFAYEIEDIAEAVSVGGAWRGAQLNALHTLAQIEARSSTLLKQQARANSASPQ